MKRVAVLLFSLLLIATGCGSKTYAESHPILPHSKVDLDAFRAELLASDDVSVENPDMARFEKLGRSFCTDSSDSLAYGFTLTGSSPDVVRIEMKYVCPSRLGRWKKAKAAADQAGADADKLCSSDRDSLSAEKQDEYDAVCTP